MTLYERIIIYCKANEVPPPTPKQRSDMGEEVTKRIRPLNKITSFENGHFIPVNNYPESANATIDFIIQKHYRK